MKSNNKVVMTPINYCVLYMVAVLLIFLLGPIHWIENWDEAKIYGVVLIVCYIGALYLGYVIGIKKKTYYSSGGKSNNNKIWMDFLKYTLYLNFVLTFLNAFEYTNSTGFSNFFSNAINGILNPAIVYYSKDASSRAGNIIVIITLLLEPLLSITRVMSLLYFSRLKKNQKIIVIMTIIIEAARWLAVGTNKGLMDILVRVVAVFWILLLHRKLQCSYVGKKKKNKKVIILIVVFVLAFLYFFSSTMSDRVAGKYSLELFADFPYNLVPEGMRVFVEKFDSYLTQGYSNMIKCIQYCKWKPTYGLGNSRFVVDIFETVSGIDLFERTYPAQLKIHGVDPLASWHSAFAWYASDFSFIGVIPLMTLVGYFFARVSKEAIVDLNPVSVTLFYFIFLGIINSSCTNYVLAYSSMFISFWGVFAIRLLMKSKYRIKITFKSSRTK